MKKILWIFMMISCLAGCGRVQTIPHDPPLTPHEWCRVQPCLHVAAGPFDFILTVPSSTVFVYLLGVLAVVIGARYLRSRQGHRSRAWMGIALVLWGAGALLAGTSYQAFSWEIKCAGRDVCAWTSWWEVWYLVCTVTSVGAMAAAVAFSSAGVRGRKRLLAWAVAAAAVYPCVALAGALVPVKLLVSFEVMLLFTGPLFVALFVVNLKRYRERHGEMDLVLLRAWILLGAVMAVYFMYLLAGWTESLWERGIWFCANDVLHLGLIAWMLYLGTALYRRLEDAGDR